MTSNDTILTGMLKNISQECLYVKGFIMEFPVINERKNDMTIVYDHAKRPFSLRIRIISTSKHEVLVTDNYSYTVRTPINRVRKALKAYFKKYGYKTLLALHA